MKITLGPWKVNDLRKYNFKSTALAVTTRTCGGRATLANIPQSKRVSDTQKEANAHAIAAVPEMLNVLIKVQMYADMAPELLEEVEAVLIKAQGYHKPA